MSVWKAIVKFSDILEYIIIITIIVSLGLIVFFVNLAVFFRYVLSSPLTWTNEISSYLLVYTVLFGAAIGLKRNQFVKIEVLFNLIPSQLRMIILVVAQALIVLFLIICAMSPSLLIRKAIITKTISPALGIPMVYLYHLLRLGFITMLFFVIIRTIQTLIVGTSQEERKESIQ